MDNTLGQWLGEPEAATGGNRMEGIGFRQPLQRPPSSRSAERPASSSSAGASSSSRAWPPFPPLDVSSMLSPPRPKLSQSPLDLPPPPPPPDGRVYDAPPPPPPPPKPVTLTRPRLTGREFLPPMDENEDDNASLAGDFQAPSWDWNAR